MKKHSITKEVFSWIFALVLAILGVLNLIYIHPVPGSVYLIFAIIMIPPSNLLLRKMLGFAIPFAVKAVLFIVISWFTLGVSDLADMYGW